MYSNCLADFLMNGNEILCNRNDENKKPMGIKGFSHCDCARFWNTTFCITCTITFHIQINDDLIHNIQ